MKLGNELHSAKLSSMDTFKIRLKFKDGRTGVVSLSHLFDKPKGLVTEILRGGIFDKFFIESGALAWPNGFELCPDALHMWMKEQAKKET